MRTPLPWRVAPALGEPGRYVAQLWYPLNEVWGDLGDPEPSDLAAGRKLLAHLTGPGMLLLDDRAEDQAPELYRAGVSRLLRDRGALCVEAGREHDEEVAPELLDHHACGIEATHLRSPMPGWPTPTPLCRAHAIAWTRWWRSYQRDRRLAHVVRGSHVQEACSSPRRRQEGGEW